ncbi:MAG TPA: SRPBCC family protein [Streptosporangiaceae bacterium]|jgi:hypothetical protein|nr:SRPBCC family protein [Streptosporangiaceae bacterium]
MTTSAADEGTQATNGECEPVRVSRRIGAPADAIFAVLADPRRHTEIDGSDMLRGAVTETPVTGVGDEFVLKMYLARVGGDYEMINRVVEFEPGRRITWEPRRNDIDDPAAGHLWGYELTPDGDRATIVTEVYDCSAWPEQDRVAILDNGRNWIEAMLKTLQRLDEVSAGPGVSRT